MAVDEHLTLEHQLCVALYKASRAINSAYRPLLADIGLTYSQYTVMLILWEQDRATLGDIARLLNLDSGTLSPLLKRMEEHGLLTRSRDPGDERVLDVVLTDHGRSIRPAAAVVQQTVEAMTGLDPMHLAVLRDELNRLTERLRVAEPVPVEA